MVLASSACAILLAAAIPLDGATGRNLRAIASFDANNVHVGDPLTLTVDFIGDADFATLHPPALSRHASRREWRIDDASAKTETYKNARRLTYRVRPVKEGLLHFPALEFSYMTPEGGERTVSTAPVPVHAKPGAQVELAEPGAAEGGMPMPDGILVSLENSPWGTAPDRDTLFAWRKACSAPSAEAFSRFDFPEARLNEAACELAAGGWAKALSIYSTLEWRIGQTPAIERGIVAALARKTDSPDAALPMWRQTFRPVLRFAWPGRLAVVLGFFFATAALLALARRLARSLACAAILLAVAAATQPAAAQLPGRGADPFEEMDRHFREVQEHFRREMEAMPSLFGEPGAFSVSFGGEQQKPPEISAVVTPDRKEVGVGETFDFIISLETPKRCTVSSPVLHCSQAEGLKAAGQPYSLPDLPAADTNRTVRRIAVPVRYDAPFKGHITFSVAGRYDMRYSSQRGRGMFFSSGTVSSSFEVPAPGIDMEVKPLPEEGRPKAFAGAVGTSFKIRQTADRYSVETNDIVVVTCIVDYNGYIPPDLFPDALERTPQRIVSRRYFVADGAPDAGEASLVWYDVAAKRYRVAKSRGMPLSYRAPEPAPQASKVVVGGEGGADATAKSVVLRFAPNDASPAVAETLVRPLHPLESLGSWVRVDDGVHAGWVRREEADL